MPQNEPWQGPLPIRVPQRDGFEAPLADPGPGGGDDLVDGRLRHHFAFAQDHVGRLSACMPVARALRRARSSGRRHRRAAGVVAVRQGAGVAEAAGDEVGGLSPPSAGRS